MQRSRALLFVILLFSLTGFFSRSAQGQTALHLPEQGDLFEHVLAETGLTPETVKIDQRDVALWGGDRYRLSLLDLFFDNPWKISAYTRTISDRLLADTHDLKHVVTFAHRRLDAGVSLGVLDNPLEKYASRVETLGEDALAIALAEVIYPSSKQDQDLSETPLQNFQQNLQQDAQYQALPPPLRKAVAQFLFAVPDILHYRQIALLNPVADLQFEIDDIYQHVVRYFVQTYFVRAGQDPSIEQILLLESLMDTVDFPLLNAGATLATIATQELQQQLSELDDTDLAGRYTYRLGTPLGRVVLSDGDSQHYGAGQYLLIVDVGGDDTYQGGAATIDLSHGISVTVDLAGDDVYLQATEPEIQTQLVQQPEHSPIDDRFPPIPAFGAGFFGYGLLIDVQGNDRYDNPALGQGVGVFGTGILYDVQGNDHYEGTTNLQGSGSFGTGLLIDGEGDDRYALYTFGQGFGSTKGFGLLLDRQGNDRYIGLEEGRPNGGPFGADRYIHMAQGAGFGRRSDFVDGHSWAGGIGMLVDGAGDDDYACEIYGQGTAYWYALGLLIDKSGNDRHHGGGYTLGGSPHFAIGIYQDDAGNDTYEGIIGQSLGTGRDWSIGWFEEGGGDDWYLGNTVYLGLGDTNGLGVFWEKGGNDTYISPQGARYGQAIMDAPDGLRHLMLTLGLFVEGGGQDQYWLLPDRSQLPEDLERATIDRTTLQTNPNQANDTLQCHPTLRHEAKRAYGCGIDRSDL